MTLPDRKVVAIVYGNRSASVMALSEAASTLCDIIWVVNSTELSDTTTIRLLARLGKVVDYSDMSLRETAQAVGRNRPDGITAFGDAQIAMASQLASALELDYFDATVADRLLDKSVQRAALRDAGMMTPHCVTLSSSQSRDEIEGIVGEILYPAILKPRHGAASRETHRVDSAEELRRLVDQVIGEKHESEMVLEEFMVGATPPPSQYFGDYVSVESAVSSGQISHLAVTGRLPSAKPFRETGLIIPSDFAPALIDEILKVATQAIKAMGIRSGCLHTEIKVTDEGLRVIEVNGRIGGFVAPVLALASPGLNFFEVALRIALGEQVTFEALVTDGRVGYVIVEQPPIGASHVVGVTGLDKLASHPSVNSVTLNRRPGDEVNWRLGSHEYVYSVLGAAPDHDGVRAVQEYIDEFVTISYR